MLKPLIAALAIGFASVAQAGPVIIMSRPVYTPPVRTYTPPPQPVKVYTPPARTKPAEQQRATAISQGFVMPVIVNGLYCTPKDREPGGRCNK